jgi:uncharacterized protein YkwD
MKFRVSIIAIAFLFVSLSCSTPNATAPTIVENGSSIVSIEKQVLQLVNEYREKKNLQPLKMMDGIVDEAEKHSQDMAAKKVGFGHGGFDARYQRILKGVPRTNSVAENVAYGNVSVKEIVKGWINSPGHRHNMEGNFNMTGIGVARDKKGILFYTQIFINQTKK